MAGEHYFIVRDKPFLVLGPQKWLSAQELLEGHCPIFCFSESGQAQWALSKLPKSLRSGSKIRTNKTIADTFGIRFVDSKGFVPAKAIIQGPAFEDSFEGVDLSAFVFPQRTNKRETCTEDIETVDEASIEQPEYNGITLSSAASTSLHFSSDRGLDTTVGNDNVALFEQMLNILEQGVLLRDRAQVDIGIQLSTVDKEIQDELHFLEFNRLGAAEGYLVYQRLRELRTKRRNVKDSAIIATYLTELLCGITQNKLSDFHSRLEKLRSRKYKLREPEYFIHPSCNGIL